MKKVKLKAVIKLIKKEKNKIVGNDSYSDERHFILLKILNKLKRIKKAGKL